MLTERFQLALNYAHEAHFHQVRKASGVPYIAHILGVAGLALEAGADEDVAIAALLHDVVEDCGGKERAEDIRRRFGDRVAHIVEACSDTDVTPKPPWRARKEAYLAHLEVADRDVLLVSCCDKLHNARSIVADHEACGDDVWERFKGGREGTLWYYQQVTEVLQRRLGATPQVHELARVTARLQQIAQPE